jgi:hypothetical protein
MSDNICLIKFYEKQGYPVKDAVGKTEKQVEREVEIRWRMKRE